MAHGIQHVQAAQFFELPSSSARGVPELRNKKWQNSNLICGTSIWGRSLSLASLMVREVKDDPVIIIRDIPMKMKRRGIEMRLIINGTGPVRVDQTLLKTIVRAYKWFNDLATGKVKNMTEIASREGVDRSYVSRVVNLAFLAPDIIESIIEGYQPADLNVEKLTKWTDLPLELAKQRHL